MQCPPPHGFCPSRPSLLSPAPAAPSRAQIQSDMYAAARTKYDACVEKVSLHGVGFQI